MSAVVRFGSTPPTSRYVSTEHVPDIGLQGEERQRDTQGGAIVDVRRGSRNSNKTTAKTALVSSYIYFLYGQSVRTTCIGFSLWVTERHSLSGFLFAYVFRLLQIYGKTGLRPNSWT
jgi:hypothetical protein